MKRLSSLVLAAVVALGLSAAPADAAFSASKLTRLSGSFDTGPQVFSYEDTGSTLATLIAADYLAADPQMLEAGDLVFVTGSNGQMLVTVTSASTTASVVARFASGNVLQASTTFDPASLVDAAGATSSGITVTGAALGDFCDVAAPYDLQDILATCYVQATDTVEIRLQNEGAATVDLASGSWKVRVTKSN